jgi:glycosyltransferase involved in cell wall biosynthesis
MNHIISIIICSFNGHSRIVKTLEALANLHKPLNTIVEIIFIDNGSSPSMIPLVLDKWVELGDKYPLQAYVENQPGKVAALTKGMSCCKGVYILIVDDDNELIVDYLIIGLTYLLANPEVGVLGGNGKLPESYSKPDWFDDYAYNFACGQQNTIDGNVRPKRNVVYGAGMWFRKSIFERARLNGFDFLFDYNSSNPKSKSRTNGGEDGELCWALFYQGAEVHYVSNLRFNHWLDKSKLTTSFYKVILSRKNHATLLASLYYRVYHQIEKPVKYFWVKELFFIVFHFLKNVRFTKSYFTDELIRNLSNISLLLTMRSDYDKLVNRLVDFKNKSKVVV